MTYFLVGSVADILVRFGGGDSPLRLVLHSLNEDSSFNAVSNGCVPLEVNPWRQSTLYISVAHGCVSVVRYLLSLVTPRRSLSRRTYGTSGRKDHTDVPGDSVLRIVLLSSVKQEP